MYHAALFASFLTLVSDDDLTQVDFDATAIVLARPADKYDMSLLAVCFTHCIVCQCCQLLTSLITRPCLILHARTQANVNTSKENRENTDSREIMLTHSLWPVRLMAVYVSTKLTSISHKDDKQLFFHGERIRKVCFQRFERLQSANTLPCR